MASADRHAEDTITLLRRAQSGDQQALEQLLARYLPRLHRWAAGRLPRTARDLLDTDDLVQETVVRTIRRLDDFEPRHDGALQAYLRQAILNRIRDEARRVRNRPEPAPLDGDEAAHDPSPLEEVIGRDLTERYEGALMKLRDDDREAIILRIELDLGYQEVADALAKPTAAAARMAVSRALVRLAREMDHGD